MAQPTNTFDSYDAVGAKESVDDKIYMISPEETPLVSLLKKKKVTAHKPEWQTDALRASAVNAHIQGDDTVASARTATTMLDNRVQQLKDAVSVPDTDETTDKYGRAKEIKYQTFKIGKELRIDLEKALFANQAKVTGSSTAAAYMAGLPAWLATNTLAGTGTAADPTGDGSDTRTDGTAVAFTQARMDTTLKNCWDSGGRVDTVLLSSNRMETALGFVGMNNQRTTVAANTTGKNTVVNTVDVYRTPWGVIDFVMSRECRDTDVFALQSDMWCVGVKMPFYKEKLAKTGTSTKVQVVGEYTLIAKNEASSGIIADCS